MKSRLARNSVNVVLFQLTWLVCVQGESRWAIAVTSLALLLHWRLVLTNTREWQLCVAAAVLGFGIDTLMLAAGVLRLPDASLFAPLWLVCLWLIFATTLLHSLSFLQRHLLLAACFGYVGGPLSYYVGVQFGAAALGVWPGRYGDWVALAVLAASWAVVLPLLVLVARYLDLPPQRIDGLDKVRRNIR